MRFGQNTAAYQLVNTTVGTGPTYTYYSGTAAVNAGFFQVSNVQKTLEGANQFFSTARVIIGFGTQPAAGPVAVETIRLLATDTAGTAATTTVLATLGASSATTAYVFSTTDFNQVAVFDVNMENRGQYLAVDVYTNAGTGGIPMSAWVIFGDASQTPVDKAQSGATTPTGGAAARLYAIVT